MKSHRAFDPTGHYIGSYTASEINKLWSNEYWAERCEQDDTDWSEVWIESGDCLLPPYEFLAVHEADFFRGDLDSFLSEFHPSTRKILSTLYSPASLKSGPFQAKLHCSTGQRTVYGGYITEDIEDVVDVYPIPFEDCHLQKFDDCDEAPIVIHCLRTSSMLVGELLVYDVVGCDELLCYTHSGDIFYYGTGIKLCEMLPARAAGTCVISNSATRWGQRPAPNVLLSYTSNR